MTPPIRRLADPADRALVAGFFERAGDYIAFETGLPPTAETVEEFFTATPPGGDLARSHKLGLFASGRLAALGDLGFGFPAPEDAYIGLLLVAPDQRGAGLGPLLLARMKAAARAEGSPRLLLAVLDENRRGRAFWEREGFRRVFTASPATFGVRTHVRHRMELKL